MDNELKVKLELLNLQQEAILENQQKIVHRLEVIEDFLELNSPSVQETPAKIYINEAPDFKNEPVLGELKPQVFGKEQENLEFKIGGTLLNRLGSVAIILGLSYFLKYSFDNHWIGDTGRIILGILLGLALLGVGEKLRTKYFLYSQPVKKPSALISWFNYFKFRYFGGTGLGKP